MSSSIRYLVRRILSVVLLSVLAPAYVALAQAVTQFTSPVEVGEQSAPLQVTVTMVATGTPTDPLAVTEGIAGQDFSLAVGGTCSDAPVTAGQQCFANVVFAPKYPGLRQGAVIIKTADGTLLGCALVSGIGTGSLAVLDPGVINTVVGDSEWFYAGDNVAAVNAPIHEPAGVLVDGVGNIYLSDSENYRIRRVDGQAPHTITTIAGTGNPGYSGDVQAVNAEISTPAGMAMDGAGNIYFADTGNQIVRRIGIDGVITTVAGTPQSQGYSGDGGAATAAKLFLPEGVALDASGNLYIADTGNQVIREVDASSGNISTIAGVAGIADFNHDGDATTSHLNQPWSVVVAADNSLYIADRENNRIRRLSGGMLSTIAGTGGAGYGGDNGPAAAATLNLPLGVAIDPAGDLYIADSGNDRVRKVSSGRGDVTTGSATIQTIIGTSEGYSGDKGPANQANLHGPYVVFFAQNGDLYVADTLNNRIRNIFATPVALPQFPETKITKTSSPPVPQGLDSDGNADLNLSAPTLVNAALDTTSTTCSFTTATVKGSSCNLGIEFAPTTVQQNLQGSVTLNSTTATGLATINIFGNGLDVNPTTMLVTASPSPGVLNQPVIFTATVSSNDPSTPVTGPVTFVEGSTPLCSNVSLSGGSSFCSTSSLSLGSHTITANYAGDANNEANTAFVIVNVRQQPTVTLTVNPASQATVLQSVTLTITVVAPPPGTATGSVVFYDGGSVLSGPLALNGSGVATFSTSALTPGQHRLSAQYLGDTTNAPGTSNVASELIAQSDTTITLSTTNATPTVGESLALTAIVSSADGAVPAGVVSFTDNGAPMNSAALDGSGAATIAVSSLSPGTHSIVAHYAGDTDNAASESSPLTESVAQIETVTTLSSDANPVSAGATLHLTATVSLVAGATADGPLMGTVTFADGVAAIGTATIDGSGQATLPLSTLSVGTHTLAASYSGATDYAPSDSAQLTQQVQKTSTTVSVTSSATSVLVGEEVSFTATVTSSTGIPAGTATLYDGVTALQTQSLNAQGIAAFSINTLSAGNHPLSISYSGDANYSTSSSTAFAEAVNLAQPQITLGGPVAPVNVGAAVTLTGSITSPGIHPTGTLTLRDGAASIASEAVSSAGGFTFSISSLPLGTHQLSVTYAGDNDNASASSAMIAVTIQQAPTATALGADSNPGTFGQSVTFTASVVSDSPGTTGSVNFFDGAAQIGSVSLTSNGTAAFTTTALGFGIHSITAIYTGDAQHAASTSTAISEHIVEPATATLSSSANPSVAGTDIAFIATIVAQGSQIPTGAVNFHDNGAFLGSANLNATGSATLHTSALPVGSHNITLSYAGDPNVAAASASLTQAIQAATTNIVLTASAALVTYSNPLTLTATSTSNGAVATGYVAFTENGASVGSAPINAQGIAALTLTTLTPGTHTILANYGGDGRATPATSTPVVIVVKQATSLVIASSTNPTLTASPITWIATLTNSGAAAATGPVIFSDGSTQLGTATLGADGRASLTLPSLPSGTHSIRASYAGDGDDFASTSSPLSQIVNLRATTTTLTASQTDAANPQQVTLIAVVHGDGSSAPSGTVTFSSSDLPIGSAAIDANGVATLTILLETSSSKENIVATYGGDATFQSSNSAATEAAAGPATQFTLAIDPAAVTVVSKQHTSITLSLASIKGFNDSIQLGCLGLPFAATCTFSTPQVKLAPNGAANATLTIDTGDPLGIGAQASTRHRSPGTAPLLCVLPAALIAGLSRRRRKLFKVLLLAVCCFAVALTVSGCAGLQGNGTPPGSYTFKVTASGQGSGATQSQVITLTVTQ